MRMIYATRLAYVFDHPLTGPRIANAVVSEIARGGVGRLTHRGVAKAAGTSLSATTYYFETKADMIALAASQLMAGCLADLRRFTKHVRNNKVEARSLTEICMRFVTSSAGRNRTFALAWSELIIAEAREPNGHVRTRRWFDELSDCWADLATALSLTSSQAEVHSAIDLVVGLQFLLLALGLDEPAIASITDDAQLSAIELPLDTEDDFKGPPRSLRPKALATRDRILQGSIDVLIENGAGAVGYRTVAERSGSTLTAPAYYFSSISLLLRAAEQSLFGRSKDRYREVFQSLSHRDLEVGELADVTGAIIIREATEFGKEALAFYSIWLEAARNPDIRPQIADAVHDQMTAWQRRLTGIGRNSRRDAFLMVGLFIGCILRSVACGADVGVLAGSRREFLLAFERGFSLPG